MQEEVAHHLLKCRDKAEFIAVQRDHHLHRALIAS